MPTLEELKKRKDELTALFSDPEVLNNPERLQALSFEFNQVQKEIGQKEREGANMQEPEKTVMEIRPGTGGEEAALFANQLLTLYKRFAEKKGWKVAVIDEAKTDLGGIKYVALEIQGKNAYHLLKHEGGIHRVQRIPATEKSGRIHTSAVSVAVLAVFKHTPIELKPEDLIVETAKSSGPGGQNVNKRMTAAKITHKPTGIIVGSQIERSLEQNKQRALALLKSKIYALEQEKNLEELSKERKEQVGTGERSEKIRTYNFPQDRVTDHRINKSWYNLEGILQGNIDDIVLQCSKIAD